MKYIGVILFIIGMLLVAGIILYWFYSLHWSLFVIGVGFVTIGIGATICNDL